MSKESENAKAVARDVIKQVGKGGKVVMGKIIKKHGYTKSMSKHPEKVKKTKSYQKEIKPFIQQLKDERQRLFTAIKRKKLNKLQYEAAVRSLDLLTKNIQLLSGKATENIKEILTDEQIDELLLRRTKKDNEGRKV